MKATLEQLLKPTIKTDIQSLLTAYSANSATEHYTLKLSNDLRHQDKTDDRFTISAIIQTGDDRPTGTKDVMAWNKALMMIFRVDVNYVQQFAGMIRDYCTITQDRVATATDTRDTEPSESDITYQYRISWQSAKPQGEPYSIIVKAQNNQTYNEESIMVREFVVIGSIFYSTNIPMEDSSFSIKLLTGAAPNQATNTWQTTTEAIWNETSEVLKVSKYVESLSSLITLLSVYPATVYAPYTCLKITVAEASTYVVYELAVASGTLPVYSYVPLLGRIKGQANIQPAFTPTKIVGEDVPKYDLDAVTRTKVFSVQRILNDVVHDYLLNLYYSSDTATKFDCRIKLTVTSLSIAKEYNAKISNIGYDDDPTETISFSVIILDEVVGT